MRWILTTPATPRVRIGLTILAWPPPAVAALLIVGELTGCARYAASCPGPEPLIASWLGAQVPVLVALLAVPLLARLGAVGSLGSIVAALPAVAALTAAGATYAPEGGAGALLGILGVAYLAGVIVGWRAHRGLRSSTG